MQTAKKVSRKASLDAVLVAMEERMTAAVAKRQRDMRSVQAAREKRRQEESRIASLAQRRTQKNLAQALRGFEALRTFGQSIRVQQVIKLCEDYWEETHGKSMWLEPCKRDKQDRRIICEGEMIFFEMQYVDEENATGIADQGAAIILTAESVVLSVRDWESHRKLEEWNVLARLRYDADRQTLTSLLTEPYPAYGAVVCASTLQRPMPNRLELSKRSDYMFECGELFGRVLIDCADPALFARYVEAAVERLSSQTM